MTLTAPLREIARIEGLIPPTIEPLAKAERLETTIPNPRLAEPPPIAPYKLHQYEGDFVLPRGQRQGGAVRTVTENDIEEFLEWGVPRFAERHPDCTREAMLPFIRMVISSPAYKAVRTDNCFGLFNFSRLPWEPRGIVCDVAVVSRKEDHPNQHKGVELTRVCREALEWSVKLGAATFHLGADLGPIAKRLGMEECGTLYQKVMR
jgi:hypothetical protein